MRFSKPPFRFASSIHFFTAFLISSGAGSSLQAGEVLPSQIDELVTQLGSDEFFEREMASMSLERMSGLPVGFLRRAKKASADPELVFRVDRILNRITEEMVLDQLANPERQFRVDAQDYFLEKGEDGLETIKTAATNHRNESVRAAARKFLNELPEAIERLVTQLGDDDFEVRDVAFEELRKLKAAALPSLKKAAATTKDAEVGFRARLLIEAINGVKK